MRPYLKTPFTHTHTQRVGKMAQVIEHLPSKVQQVLGPEFKFQLKKKYRVFSSSSKESLSYEFYFGLCLSEAFL
jgi:hypothetical protein